MRVRFSVFAIMVSLMIPQFVIGQAPVVSRSELQQAMAVATTTRQKNLEDVRTFFASEPVRAALKSGKIPYQRVDKAVATMSPDELARLAARTQQIQKDFAAGALNNQELTYIVLAIGVAVIVLIAVH